MKRRFFLLPAIVGFLAGPLPLVAQDTLTLPHAVALALDTHPAVGQADAALEAAGARVKQARSAWLPTVAGQGSLTRHQEPMIVAPLHGFDPMRPPTFDQNLVQGAVSVGYTLYDGGARSARIRKAEAGERAVDAGSESARMAVTAQVSAAYLSVLSSEELLAAVVAQREALEAEKERVRLFLEEGKAARVDQLRVDAALSRVRAQDVSARSGVALARNRLARLTGLDEGDVAGLALSPVSPAPGIDTEAAEDKPAQKDALLSAALSANPEMARVREELAGAAAGVREATAAWLPKIEANGRYADFGTLDGNHVQEWQGALQLSYPLFTGGARAGERERARAEERRISESVRLMQMEIEDEVETALAQVRETRAVREALELAVTQSQEVARIEALALEAGAGVQTDFLNSQAQLFQARASFSQARHGEILALIELARVRGDLSLEWIQENMEMVR